MMAHCSVVDGDCTAPAGIRVGSGVGDMPMSHCCICVECGEPVCRKCSVPSRLVAKRRVCANCHEWMEAERARKASK